MSEAISLPRRAGSAAFGVSASEQDWSHLGSPADGTRQERAQQQMTERCCSSGELPARSSGLARAGNSGREGHELTQPEEGGLQCLRLVRCTEANPSLGDYWKSPPRLAPCIFNFAPAIRVELTHLALLMRFYSPMSPYQLIMPCSAMPNHMRTLLSAMSCQWGAAVTYQRWEEKK